MNMGRSGAQIIQFPRYVVKTGGFANIALQGRLMEHLGPDVSPHIYGISKDAILMERLIEWLPTAANLASKMEAVQVMLQRHVWSRPAVTVWPRWRDHVAHRLRDTWMAHGEPLLYQLYPDENDCEYCLTHGDPTLANTMLNDNGDVRLIDPIPARPNLPPLKAIDQAKLIQSAYGWEAALNDSWPRMKGELAASVIKGMRTQDICRVSFWAAYHCLRISYHEERDTPAYRWAVNHGAMFYRIANEFRV